MGYDLSQAVSTLNPVGAAQAGQNLAANRLTLQDATQKMQHQQQLGDIRQQAVGAEGGYDPESHKKLLMDAGFFEEAQDMDDLMNKQITNKQQVMEKAFGIIEKTGGLVNKLGAPAWPMFRESLIRMGVGDEETLPAQYDDQAAAIAQNFTAKADQAFKVLKFRSGDQQRDILQMGGKTTVGDPYNPGSGKGSEPTALQKNVPFLAKTMNIPEDQAAQILTQSRDKSDAAIYQQLLATAMRATYGDSEESAKIAREGLNQVREYRTIQRAPAPTGSGTSAQQFEEGKTYTDAQGNKAKYVNGNWEPVQ